MNPYELFFGVLILTGITGVAAYELLLCRLYTDHPVEWQRLGSPLSACNTSGFNFFSGTVARWRMSRGLLTSRPAWIGGDSVAQWLYFAFRWSAVSWVVGLFGFVVVALLLS